LNHNYLHCRPSNFCKSDSAGVEPDIHNLRPWLKFEYAARERSLLQKLERPPGKMFSFPAKAFAGFYLAHRSRADDMPPELLKMVASLRHVAPAPLRPSKPNKNQLRFVLGN
jgi:hypothetical protein